MRITKRFTAIVLVVGLSMAFPGNSNANPTGLTYDATVTNLPGTGNGSPVFDLTVTTIGGIDIQEMATPLGTDLELIEFWLSNPNPAAVGGTPLYDNPAAVSSFLIENLNWGNGQAAVVVENSFFIYYTINGDPQGMTDVFNQGIVIAPHPLGAGVVSEVAYTGNLEIPSGPNGISFEVTSAPFVQPQVYGALGLDGLENDINDVHFGFVVKHVPEPSTFVLAGFGLLGVVIAARRRKKTT